MKLKLIRTVDGKINDFTESSSDAVHSLAQIKALVIFLDPAEHERAVGVYSQVLHVLVAGYVVIIAGFLAAATSPCDQRRWEAVGVTMQTQSGHSLRRTGVLRLHHPPWRH